MQPTVSVIMPLYNAEPFVSQAIQSILSQTYSDFELVIVDDCSADNSFAIAAKFAAQDTRIRLYKNSKHLGVATTANACIAKSRGHLLARMDADDISLPDRIQKQCAFLNTHPQVVAVGGHFLIINKDADPIGERFFPLTHEEIYHQTGTFTALSQPGMMMNTQLLPPDFHYYNDHLSTAEETELVFKLFQYGVVANIDTTILKYRMHDTNTSLKNPKKTFFITLFSRIKAIRSYGYVPSFLTIMINILQLGIVLLLPRAAILSLYSRIRNHTPSSTLSSVALEMT